MSEHTPGPYVAAEYYTNLSGGVAIRVATAGGELPGELVAVASDLFSILREEECKANARMIAAAPDLLEALEEIDVGLQFYLEEYGDENGRLVGMKFTIRDAIAKARGEQP